MAPPFHCDLKAGHTSKATIAHPSCLCFCTGKGGSGCSRVRGLPLLTDPGNAAVGDLWQQHLLADAMTRGVAG